MRLAVKHNLEVFAPTAGDPDVDSPPLILPLAEADAVMGETVAAYLDRVAWRFDLPTVCRINDEFYGRAEWGTRHIGLNDNLQFVSRPLGSGGSTAKSIGAIVAMVALTALAPYAVAGMGAALGMGAAVGTATALTFAGHLASALMLGAPASPIGAWTAPPIPS